MVLAKNYWQEIRGKRGKLLMKKEKTGRFLGFVRAAHSE